MQEQSKKLLQIQQVSVKIACYFHQEEVFYDEVVVCTSQYLQKKTLQVVVLKLLLEAEIRPNRCKKNSVASFFRCNANLALSYMSAVRLDILRHLIHL